MTPRLDDLAARAELEEAQRRFLFAPHGMRTKRLAELRAVATRIMRQDVSARRKGRRGK